MSTPLIATYRIQLNPEFGFDAAAAAVPYLAALGVSHLYCSPYLQAAPGSSHGYDVVDHGRVNSELGGAEGHSRLCAALNRHGMGQVLDVVPNHMAIGGPENRWWWDVLAYGPSSPYALYFDVDWEPYGGGAPDRVLLPVLGDHYGRVLAAGQLQVRREGGSLHLRYWDSAWPVAPGSMQPLLSDAAARSGSADLAYLADAFGGLPPASLVGPQERERWHQEAGALQDQLDVLLAREPQAAAALEAAIDALNDDPDAMDGLIERQHYRLAFWKAAGTELGYRRFFDINSLAGLRVESEPVFRATHALVLQWARQGLLDGLRVDHPDGLRDPQHYLERLARATRTTPTPAASAAARSLQEGAPAQAAAGVAGGGQGGETIVTGARNNLDGLRDPWIVIEKILAPEEKLPPGWPVAGTTGYEFLNLVGGLFVDPAGETPLTTFYREFTGLAEGYETVAWSARQEVMRDVLGSDLNRLTALFGEVCRDQWRFRDYLREELEAVLRGVAACLPVYRTYIRAGELEVSEQDAAVVEGAVEQTRRKSPEVDGDLLDFFRDLLLLRMRGGLESELVTRFQQFTGPVMAKGVEDTACYRHHPLLCLNEVGGAPERFGRPLDEFHAWCGRTQQTHPQTMLATSTHDTKRSEDVRARIALLSEVPEEWAMAVRRWAEANETRRREGFPDRNAEYLFYQTLFGAWPISTQRMVAYMEKAAREAKVFTSWTRPDADYEDALRLFIQEAMSDTEFIADAAGFVSPLIAPGRTASLAQALLKLTAPGVPDLYQGSELWDLSLVDPDNRRPVDYAGRAALLDHLGSGNAREALSRWDDGLPKLFVIQRALALRRRVPAAFGGSGGYRPLHAHGKQAHRAVAFARGDAAITIVPRLVLGLQRTGWEDTRLQLPPGDWNGIFAGGRFNGEVELAGLLGGFPVALLERNPAV